MKRLKMLVVGIVLFLASCAAGCATLTGGGSRDFVHPLQEMPENRSCSAITVAPGLVLTAAHCVEGMTGVIGHSNDRLDLALVQSPTVQCPCARIADREADRDEIVYVVGFPHGLGQVVSIGTSQGVFDHEGMPYGRRLVTTATVAGGNSGGGVFVFRDGQFQLVGVLVEMIGNMSMAVPLADVRPFLAGRI